MESHAHSAGEAANLRVASRGSQVRQFALIRPSLIPFNSQRQSSPDGAGSERGLRELGWNTGTRQTRRGAPVGVQRFVLPIV